MTAPAKRLYTVAEAAKQLDMGRSTLYRAIQDKAVPYRLMPGTSVVKFTDDDIAEIIALAYRPATAA